MAEQDTNEVQPDVEDQTAEEVAAEEAAEAQATMEANVDAKLRETFHDGPIPEEENESGETPTPETEADAEEETTPDDSQAETETDADAEDPPAGSGAGEDPPEEPAGELELTSAEIRAAAHMGYSEEDIKELHEANPELAKKTCATALKSTNNLSKQFSELGAKLKATDSQPASDTPAEPEPKPAAKPIDLSSLEDEYGDDPIFGVVKSLAEQNAALASQIEGIQSSTDPANNDAVANAVSDADKEKDAAVAQQIDTFFASPDVTAFDDHYGITDKESENWDNLTQKQVRNRMEVVETANLIMQGARHQGQEMPLVEAFERAHLMAIAPVQEQVIRAKINKSVKKRAAGITLKPNTVKKAAPTGKLTADQLEAKVAGNLAATFK